MLVGILGLILARGVLVTVIVASLIAFLLAPTVKWLDRYMPRWLAILLAYLLFVAGVIFLFFVVPVLFVGSIDEIDLTAISDSIDDWVIDFLTDISSITVFGFTVDLSSITQPMIDAILVSSPPALALTADQVSALLFGALEATAGLFGVVVSILSFVIFTLLIALYLSGSGARFAHATLGLFPANHQAEAAALGRRFSGVWNDYIRGELTLMVIMGVTTGIAVWLIGVPGAFVLGLIAGLLEVIPTFGPIFATIPAVLVALVQGSIRFPDMNNVRLRGVGDRRLRAPAATGEPARLAEGAGRVGSDPGSRRAAGDHGRVLGGWRPRRHPRRAHGRLGPDVRRLRMGQGHRRRCIGDARRAGSANRGWHRRRHDRHGRTCRRLVASSAVSQPETREPSAEGDGLISRVKTTTDLARQRALETLERERIRNPMVRVAYQSYERDKRFAGGVLAGGLSYRLFLFLLPFSLFSVTALGAVVDGLEGELSDVAQHAGLSASLAASVGAAVNTSDRGLFLILGAAIVLTLASGIGVIKTMRLISGIAWQVDPGRMSRRLVASAILAAAFVVLITIRALLLRISAGPLTETILIAVELLIVVAAVVVAFRSLPRADGTGWPHLVPGRAIGCLGLRRSSHRHHRVVLQPARSG